MHNRTSFALGMACFACTLVILFGDVRSLDDLSVFHLYILAGFVVSVGAGHYMWRASLVTAIAFAIIFVTGTTVCVVLSGSRSHASLEKRMEQALAHNKRRDELIAAHDAAVKELEKHKLALDRYSRTVNEAIDSTAEACATGRGSRCTGSSASTELRQAREEQLRANVTTAQAKLDAIQIPPHIEPNAELKPLAQLYSLLTGAPHLSAMAMVILILSYSLAVLTEFSGVVFLHHAFTPQRVTREPPLPSPLPAPIPSLLRSTPSTPAGTIALADIARELSLDPRIARKRVRELGIEKPLQGWSFTRDVADDIKRRLTSA